MMYVDPNKCIGCGLCVKDCFVKDIEMIDGKARIKNITCFKCGHCIAVCPKNAVSTDEYDMKDVIEYNKESFEIEPDTLLNFIKFRRTIRHFMDKKIEREKILKIIEAGRFTETGSNSQNVSYIVVEKDIQKLRELTLKSLNNLGKTILETSSNTLYKRYAKRWINMYEEYKNNPNGQDELFFKAPTIILVVSESPINGGLASSNMELMINALKLGTVFSGFFVRAAQDNEEIREFLEIKGEKQIVTCMVIGYPNIKFKRTVPRKKAEIIFK
ncbi:nitroreductase family protein [Cetobacterium sp. 8H]|uniref:nitroreductase family protein n=1 Tax=Cetobacterium sp. 8H TaxID=2759681 RepID=UPI00163C3EAA|nr:nitroreductase family protein [Cetobacterium sp. 8H]MBC2851774.1 nitroreductase family protein [Cetobacterium sp. 8H]